LNPRSQVQSFLKMQFHLPSLPRQRLDHDPQDSSLAGTP
jgi:hypothetical protein